MQRIFTLLPQAMLALSLISQAGCAAGTSPSGETPSAEETQSVSGKWGGGPYREFALTRRMVPPGGAISETAEGWVIHGVHDGVSYRFGPKGDVLLVANAPSLTWQALNVENSWYLTCSTHVPTETPLCNATLLRDADFTLTGFTINDRLICPQSGVDLNGFWPAEMAIDGGRRYRVDESTGTATLCLSAADDAAARQELVHGRSLQVRGLRSNVEATLSLYGFQQARAMSDWMVAQMALAKLELVP